MPSSNQTSPFAVVAVIVAVAAALAGLRLLFHPHPPFKRPPKLILNPKTVAQVAAAYDRDIQPLFKKACFDCHSSHTVWPWYHAIPGVKQFLEGHVDEGRYDLDMDGGFPFKGHGAPERQLRGISRLVAGGRMPLWEYSLMHPAARLSPGERAAVVAWADGSYDALTRTAKPAP